MRISTLRSMWIALIFVVLDISLPGLPLLGGDIFPDAPGLLFVFFCAVLLLPRSRRFLPVAVYSLTLILFEVIRLAGMIQNDTINHIFGLLYLFFKMFCVLSLFRGLEDLCTQNERTDLAPVVRRIGYLYVLCFPLYVWGIFWQDMARVFGFLSVLLSVFALCAFFGFYRSIKEPIPDPPPEPLLDEDGNPILALDEDGNPIPPLLDENGDPIPGLGDASEPIEA